ncbi:MAG: 50S ribosomal protein L31e [Euryarchaeota archaeon RBG_16_68_13]|nr:MAG: 50S ribosomal protein L31e [Euryarchaeota archaeon RBG_16_68_13]
MAEQEEERILVIPLRAARAASRTDRAPRAVKAIREYVKRHMKPDRIFIDDVVNEAIWARGREKPPPRIRVKAIKFEDGSAVVSLPED